MDSTRPVVSIVIPVKNEEKRLPLCLEGINELEYDKSLIEIIVVDNGSDDATVKLAESFGCKVYIDEKLSVAGLRNLGAKYAIGEYLGFVDADVIVSPLWLNSALSQLKMRGVACVTGLINIPEDNTWVEKNWSLNRKTTSDTFYVRWASSMNMVLKRSVFNEIDGFSTSLVTGEDVDLCSRIINAGHKILYDSKVSVIHIGEAKTLKDFIRKERWRGYSDLDLLLANNFKLSNLRHATQPLFFIFSWVFLLFSVFIGDPAIIGLSLSFVVLLPTAKTLMVSKKQRTLRYVFSLFVIWFIYYYARSVAIFDNIKHRIIK